MSFLLKEFSAGSPEYLFFSFSFRVTGSEEKLELEWQKELSALEEDKTQSYLDYKKTQARLHELNYKLEQYRVHDQNMKEDRWSLDPELYYKK